MVVIGSLPTAPTFVMQERTARPPPPPPPPPWELFLAIRRQPFDGGDRLTANGSHFRHAGANRPAAHQYRAGAAQSHSAPELGALQVQYVAQHPQQGSIRRRVHRDSHIVNLQLNRHLFTSQSG